MFVESLMNTLNAADWSTGSCACAVMPVTLSDCSLLVVPTVGALGERRGFCPSCGARRMADSAALLVDEVLPQQPMRQWVLSAPFQLRFLLASQPAIMGKVLGIVYRAIATHISKKAGHTKTTAHTGAVTLIQRFGGAINLNVHFHMLFLDGVYIEDKYGSAVRFQWIKSPTSDELARLTHTIAKRIGRFLERQGLLERDAESRYLNSNVVADENDPMHQLHGASVTYRIALGPRQGRKVFTLQTIPASDPEPWVGKVDGFSLHAGVATKACQRKKRERICRYIARPPVAEKRLSLTRNGMVRYELKTPYRDGTTHVIFEPLDFISKLAALVPKPRVNLTRFHGVFAPNSKHRTLVTPGRRGRGRKIGVSDDTQIKPPEKCRASLDWAQRLKRVFNMDVEICDQCGGTVKVIACIEDPAVIKKILDHLDKTAPTEQGRLPQSRAPP
jgi:hypothetical protein